MKMVTHLHLIKTCPKCGEVSRMFAGEDECIQCAVHEEYTRSMIAEVAHKNREANKAFNVWEADNDLNPKRGA